MRDPASAAELAPMSCKKCKAWWGPGGGYIPVCDDMPKPGSEEYRKLFMSHQNDYMTRPYNWRPHPGMPGASVSQCGRFVLTVRADGWTVRLGIHGGVMMTTGEIVPIFGVPLAEGKGPSPWG